MKDPDKIPHSEFELIHALGSPLGTLMLIVDNLVKEFKQPRTMKKNCELMVRDLQTASQLLDRVSALLVARSAELLEKQEDPAYDR